MTRQETMSEQSERWLDRLRERNDAFQRGIDIDKLPVARSPGRFALITCMDPRINLTALGIEPFAPDDSGVSEVRVIRTIGAMAEDRSLIVGIHLAGIREIALVMHTDCGNCLAKAKIDKVVESLRTRIDQADYNDFRASIGEPFPDKLIEHLKAFDDPRQAVRQEVDRVRRKPFVPNDIVVHGLVYELETARLEVVVDGYVRRSE